MWGQATRASSSAETIAPETPAGPDLHGFTGGACPHAAVTEAGLCRCPAVTAQRDAGRDTPGSPATRRRAGVVEAGEPGVEVRWKRPRRRIVTVVPWPWVGAHDIINGVTMPTCTQCKRWTPSSIAAARCPECGGTLQSADELVKRDASARGMTPEAYRATREAERKAEQRLEDETRRARAAAELETEAAAAGLTAAEYTARQAEGRWQSDGGYLDIWLVLSVVAVPVTCLAAVVVAVVLLIVGRAPVVAFGAPFLAGVAGMVLGQAVFFAAWVALGALAAVSRFVRRQGGDMLLVSEMAIVVLPAAIVVIVPLLVT